MICTDHVDTALRFLDVCETDLGVNLLIAEPFDPVVLDRTTPSMTSGSSPVASRVRSRHRIRPYAIRRRGAAELDEAQRAFVAPLIGRPPRRRQSVRISVTFATLVSFVSDMRYGDVVDYVHPVQAVIPGAQGRVLAVLAQTTAELNLSTLARLADVSVAQASRVMPGLVDLGLVERRETPPSSQFRLIRENVAAQAIIDLARSRDTALDRIGAAAAALRFPPVSVIVFGSFARGEADEHSDVDAIVVRPDEVDEDDDAWATAIERWRSDAQAITGNRIEILEVARHEAGAKLAGRAPLWRDVLRDGVVVYGLTIDELMERVHA
jgi:predicted nucleotidyltransferase